MIKKIFIGICLLFSFVLFLQPVYAEDDQPYISLRSEDSYSKGVLEFSSTGLVKIKTSAHNISGTGQITIYKANIDDVLKYLIHDKDYKQLNPNIDVKDKQIVSTFNNIQFDSNINNEIEIPLDSSGIWIAQAKMGEYADSTFIIRNTYGALSKEAKDSIIIWGQDFSTKKNLQNASVKLYNLNGYPKVLANSSLGGDGIASLPLTIDADIATVESDGQIAIIPLNETNLNGYFRSIYSQNKPQNKFFPFTDRPIYKPGDTVYFKSIIRSDDDARYSIPSGIISAQAYTDYGENKTVVYKQNLTIDNQGNIYGQFKLPENAPVGYYSLEFTDSQSDNNEYSYYRSTYFQVEYYRKPEVFLTSFTAKNELVRGDQINIDVSGQFFSGQPLANTDVSYKITSSNGYDSEYFYPQDNNFYSAWYGDSLGEGHVTLDSKGHGVLSIPTDKYASDGKDKIYSIEFKYTDFTGNTSISGNNFYIHSGQLSIYRTDDYVWSTQINQQTSIPLIIKSNSSISFKRSATIKTERKWWEKKEDNNQKYPTYESHSELLSDSTIKFDASGKSQIVFTPTKFGSYIFTVEIKDDRGNIISKEFSIWVSDSQWYKNYTNTDPSLLITADKKSYNPGDTARVEINSSIADRDLLLSIERGYMDRYQIVHLTGTKTTVDIPLVDHDMPNIIISVSSFGNDKLNTDNTNIAVSPQKMKLKITATTDKAKYGPGDEVTVNINTTDIGGNPVSANLAIWTVDKALFELADKNYGDIFENFWSERYNNTLSNNSLQGINISDNAEMGGCFLPDTLITLSDGSYKKISDLKIGDKILTKKNPESNKLVVDTVQQIKTAKESSYLIINGKLRLTSDHIIFINGNWHTAGSAQVGDTLLSQNSTPVKIFSIEKVYNITSVYNLSLKRYHTFFADNLWVHNEKGGGPDRENFNDAAYWNPSVNTDSNGRAQITFKLPDNLTTWQVAVVGSSLDTKLGEAYTDFKVQKDLVIRPVLPNLLRQGDSFNLSAIVHNFTDIDRKVTVSLVAPDLDIQSASQNIKLAANSFQQIYWPVKTSKVKSDAKLTYSVKESGGLSDTIIQKIDILAQGYWDQRYQSVIGNNSFNINLPSKIDPQLSTLKLDLSPSLLGSLTSSMEYLLNYPYGCTEQTTSRLVPLITAKYNQKLFSKAIQGKNLDKMIDTGIDRLKKLQGADGGWSWWHGTSDPFVTGYVAKNLYQLKQIGANVPQDMIDKTISYFKSLTDNNIMVNYGLSYLSPSGLKPITDQLNNLPDDYLALTVITNIRLGDVNPSSNGLDLLISRAQKEGQTLYWNSGSIDRFGSVEASTALAAQALTLAKSELAPQAIMYLSNHRDHGYWYNSFATVQAINAIVNYSIDHNDTTPNYNYTTKIDGQKLTSGSINSVTSIIPQVSIDLKKYKNPKTITVEKNGQGEIYSSLTSKFWITDNQSPEVNNGISITRQYINRKGKEYNIVPGDLVDVTINISSDQGNLSSYAIIEDHLPAGLIPVNTHLDNESTNLDKKDYYQQGYYYIEYTQDGALIPIYQSGVKTYTYLARAVNPGDFVAPPATVSLMYNPAVFGRTTFDRLTIETEVKKNPFVKKNFTITNQNKNNKIAWIIGVIISPGLIILIDKKLIPYVKNKIRRMSNSK